MPAIVTLICLTLLVEWARYMRHLEERRATRELYRAVIAVSPEFQRLCRAFGDVGDSAAEAACRLRELALAWEEWP